jgi:hypothetical protein
MSKMSRKEVTKVKSVPFPTSSHTSKNSPLAEGSDGQPTTSSESGGSSLEEEPERTKIVYGVSFKKNENRNRIFSNLVNLDVIDNGYPVQVKNTFKWTDCWVSPNNFQERESKEGRKYKAVFLYDQMVNGTFEWL